MVALIGSNGSMDQTLYAQLNSFGDEVELVRGGDLEPSVGAGLREAIISAGWVRCCGCLAKFVGSTSVSLAANGGSKTRRDYRIAEFNWRTGAGSTSPLGTLSNTVALQTLQGPGGGALPTLTKVEADLWQVPLGLYEVPAGGGAVTVTDVRPRRRLPRVYKDTPAVITMGSGSGGRQVSLRVIPDPGWPHRLELTGSQSLSLLTGNGRGNLLALVDGVQITSAEAGRSNTSPAVLRSAWTDVRTGPATVEYVVVPVNVVGEPMSTLPQHSGFTTIVHPA